MADEPKTETQTVRFLAWLRPPGRAFPGVTLTAIPIEGGNTTTETHFDAKAGAGWVARFAGRQNCYYMVNPPLGTLSKKAAKSEVAAVALLHVDIDPAKGSDWEAERDRILSSLQAYKPRPSAVIDSGNGYQALWRLHEAVALNGPDDWSRLEAYNRQLALDLRGDSTFDVSRILRLPGPSNLPNRKKRDAGRVERPTSIEWMEDSAYELADFIAAPLEERAAGGGFAVSLPSNLPPVNLDTLPAAVTHRTRMLIVHGDDPDDSTRYASKSEVMWAVTCEMVRAKCTDDEIAAVLLHSDFGISDHPLRQKRSAEYVARQIERARDEVAEPMLRELNDKHFAVGSIGGKFRVAGWRRSEIDAGREAIEYQTVGDFANRYMHRRVQVGTAKGGSPIYAPAGKWWLSHPMRRQYETVVFAPNEQLDELEAFNLWRGLAVQSRTGEWPLLRRLIWEALASSDEAHFDYIMRWLAFAVQHPERPAEVALVLRGGRGIGKSTVGHVMRRIFGQHGLNVTHGRHLHGNFNDHLHDCCLLFADEAVAPGDREAEQMIKVMITEPTLLIEPKGLGKFMATNRLHVIMASNERWVVPAGTDERRFAVFDVSAHLAVPQAAGRDHPNAGFWDALYLEIDDGGIEAFLHDLLSMDLSGWHPRRGVPQTCGLLDQKVSSLRDFARVWFEILDSGELPEMGATQDYGSDHVFISTRQFRDYARMVQTKSETITETEIGMFFDRMGFRKVEKSRPRGYVLPPLIEARAAWDEKMFRFGWGAARGWDMDGGRGGYADDGPY